MIMIIFLIHSCDMMVLHWGGSVLSGTVRWHGAIECWYGI